MSYAVCSSTLLVLNKQAVVLVQIPSVVLLSQLASCSLILTLLRAAGAIECDRLQWSVVKKFWPVVLCFVGTLYSNVMALSYVSVDTIICCRASMSIVVAVLEFLFLDRQLPSKRSWCALGGILAGVAVFSKFDLHLQAAGYIWLAVWYAFQITETVWVKFIVDTVPMTNWTRALYQNSLAAAPLLVACTVNGDLTRFTKASIDINGWAVLVLSCGVGISMSYTVFALREQISATAMSVIGNLCKVATILINIAVSDDHAGTKGTVALLLCIVSGAAYVQPPFKEKKRPLLS